MDKASGIVSFHFLIKKNEKMKNQVFLLTLGFGQCLVWFNWSSIFKIKGRHSLITEF